MPTTVTISAGDVAGSSALLYLGLAFQCAYMAL
jgi:hypothetical protein